MQMRFSRISPSLTFTLSILTFSDKTEILSDYLENPSFIKNKAKIIFLLTWKLSNLELIRLFYITVMIIIIAALYSV